MTPQHPQARHPYPFLQNLPAALPLRRRASTIPTTERPPPPARRATAFPSHPPARCPSPEEAGAPAALIWLNGFPGVGKLTIAQWLHRLVGTDRSLILDHQAQPAAAAAVLHAGGVGTLPPTPELEIADPFLAGPGAGGEPAGSLEDLLSRPENEPRTIIVMSCVLNPVSSSSGDVGVRDEQEDGEERGDGRGGTAERAQARVQDQGRDQGKNDAEDEAILTAKACLAASVAHHRPFLPVSLTCQEEENMRRVQSLERRYSSASSLPTSSRRPSITTTTTTATTTTTPPSCRRPSSSSTSSVRSRPPPRPASFSRTSSRERISHAGVALSLREGRSLFVFEDVKGLELDVTDLEAHEAAMEILSFVSEGVEEWGSRQETREVKEKGPLR